MSEPWSGSALDRRRRREPEALRIVAAATSAAPLLLALALATGCDVRLASRSHHETTSQADLGVDASTVDEDASVAPDLGSVDVPDAQLEVDLGPVIPLGCGDGVVDGVERCDDGLNTTPYQPLMTTAACGPTCQFPHYCGDGIVDAAFGEACDRGAADNLGQYGGCNADCTRPSHCGDGVVDVAFYEQCDDGNDICFDNCTCECIATLAWMP